MIAALLDEGATKAGDRYVNFLLSLRSVLNSSLKVRAEDARAFAAIRSGAYEVAQVFLDAELEHLEVALEDARERALELARDEVLSDDPTTEIAVTDYLEELLTWFRMELRSQIERDVNVLIAKRRELALAAATSAWSRGRDVQAAFENLIASGREKVDFYFTDRSGRRYPAQKFYRQLFRHAALTFAVETFVMEVAAFGVDTVFVAHPDHNNSFHGEAVSLVGDANVLSLADIRDDVFHPNSNAFLTTIKPT